MYCYLENALTSPVNVRKINHISQVRTLIVEVRIKQPDQIIIRYEEANWTLRVLNTLNQKFISFFSGLKPGPSMIAKQKCLRRFLQILRTRSLAI